MIKICLCCVLTTLWPPPSPMQIPDLPKALQRALSSIIQPVHFWLSPFYDLLTITMYSQRSQFYIWPKMRNDKVRGKKILLVSTKNLSVWQPIIPKWEHSKFPKCYIYQKYLRQWITTIMIFISYPILLLHTCNTSVPLCSSCTHHLPLWPFVSQL